MSKKRITYAKPEIGKEEFVRHLFSMYSGELGFEIVNIQKAFPDCVAIDCRHNGRKKVNWESHGGSLNLSFDEQSLANEA
ncbi:MAG: hypothetical protein ACLFRG_14885 [Desulfococcaceae bacterium]